jgi:FkbM family methyltransferase
MSIGANLGVYPLQFATWSAPDGIIFAFEPNPETASVLRMQIHLNHLTNRVHVIEQAVADCLGEATFHRCGVSGMSRLGEENPALKGQASSVTVPVVSVDHFCESRGVRPTVMMIDIEGFEALALSGARALFTSEKPPVTVVEMHPDAWAVAGTDRAAMERLLEEYRLRPVALSGQTDPFGEHGHVALEPKGH